jgi:hypothetical protein
VLDWLDEIESDMSAVHRVDDIWSMPAAKFFRFAWLLPAYRGAVRERRLREQHETGEDAPAPQQQYEPPGYTGPSRNGPAPGTRTLIENDPMFSQIIGFG